MLFNQTCVCKNVQNWKFFEERYVTKQSWLAWFHKSKNNTANNKSYADVVCGKNISPIQSIGKSAQFHLHSKVKPSINLSTQAKTKTLERQKHQSPVECKNLISSKATVKNIPGLSCPSQIANLNLICRTGLPIAGLGF